MMMETESRMGIEPYSLEVFNHILVILESLFYGSDRSFQCVLNEDDADCLDPL